MKIASLSLGFRGPLLALLVTTACGGDPSAPDPDSSTGGQSTGGTKGSDGGTSTGGGSGKGSGGESSTGGSGGTDGGGDACEPDGDDCDSGFECAESEDGFVCINIDECTQGLDDCDEDSYCVDSAGSYSCESCPAGHALEGSECVDIDECEKETHSCAEHAACSNTEGSYECACLEGFSGDGHTCQDIDECAEGLDGCEASSSCVNTPGSFSCEACPAGHKSDGSACVDVDECAEGLDTCDDNAECTNIEGSFTCECDEGFTDDGHTCQDINECLTNNGGCDPLVACTNTPGSFTCGDCPAGYTGGGASGCTDIDECLTNNGGCDPLTTCTNSPGSFTCGACPAGYAGDGTSGCIDIDECVEGIDECDDNAECTNIDSSYECACNEGFTGDGWECAAVNTGPQFQYCYTGGHGDMFTTLDRDACEFRVRARFTGGPVARINGQTLPSSSSVVFIDFDQLLIASTATMARPAGSAYDALCVQPGELLWRYPSTSSQQTYPYWGFAGGGASGGMTNIFTGSGTGSVLLTVGDVQKPDPSAFFVWDTYYSSCASPGSFTLGVSSHVHTNFFFAPTSLPVDVWSVTYRVSGTLRTGHGTNCGNPGDVISTDYTVHYLPGASWDPTDPSIANCRDWLPDPPLPMPNPE